MSATQFEDFTLRPAVLDDVNAIHGLLQTKERALYGYSDTILAYLQATYASAGIDLEQDTCLAFNPTGQLIGAMKLDNSQYRDFESMVCVYPPQSGSQLDGYLLHLAESRARVLKEQADPGAEATMASWISSLDQENLRCYERAGFHEVRRNWRMEIEFDEPPTSPIWPEGVELRPFDPEMEDRAVFEQVERSFQEDWVFTPEDFAEWRDWTIEQPSFDPSLCFLAWEGDQLVGSAICHAGPPSWVNTLAVIQQWRGKGLGIALLQHAFGEFYRRGWRRAGLAVHAENPTGATRLYLRAGMRKTREYLNMKKIL